MPDLFVHIAFPLLLSVMFKIKNWKLLVIGAVLPDLSRALMILFSFLRFDELKSYLILAPMHTPFIMILFSISVALIFNNFFRNFLLIFLGIITHFFLDILQFSGTFGQILFYPVYIKEYTLNLFYGGNLIFPIMGIIVSLICLFFLKEKSNLRLNKNPYFFIIPIIISAIFLFSTQNILIENNVHGINFLLHPEKYENKEVNLYNSKIVSLNPLTLDEMGHNFVLETKEKLEIGSQITINGIYNDKKINVNSIFFHNNNKEIFSSFALIFFLILLFKK